MNPTVRAAAAALFATVLAAVPTTPLVAQSVLISEVRADAGGRWVELHNRTTTAVDLSWWSLHHASRTPGMPQNYWWAFPVGTSIAANGFLRVHWFAPATASAAPGELYTGDTPYDFLFGLGGEALGGARGAFGLLRSQQDAMMNSSSIVEDWVSWGEHGFQREPLAVAAGLWTAGQHAPAIPAGQSLARNAAMVGGGPQDQQWFLDASPTPLAPNLTGAAIASYGASCAPAGNHLLGVPLLRAPTLPLLGNAQFTLSIDNTTGIYGEHVLVAWSAASGAAGQPSVLPPATGGCGESIDIGQLVAVWLLPAQVVTTNVPLSLANMPQALVGSELHAQALVLDLLPYAFPPYQGMSNALRIVFGQ